MFSLKLKNKNLYLRRLLFGRSSERYIKEDPNQLKLDFGGKDTLTQESQARLEAAKETITYEQKKKKKKKENASQPVRQPLPVHLEHKEEIIEPDPLPEGSKLMGEDVTEVRGRNGWPSTSSKIFRGWCRAMAMALIIFMKIRKVYFFGAVGRMRGGNLNRP
ncbi:MAG: transposase [Tannerella sp.]|jgi:hypothetical protein|nr:transposase [Tannerella sp.]